MISDIVREQCFYYTSCSLTFELLSKHPSTNQRILSERDTHRLNAILSTSGMYDQSGEFAFTVGLPAKSGVGGGVVAIIPGTGVIAAWSPPLNFRGNSVRGLKMVKHLSKKLGLSLF
ncbi:MAG: hypothetical protein CME81_06035 [Halomonas sp.]|nr:hypothetical protein [Halomonas sp.]